MSEANPSPRCGGGQVNDICADCGAIDGGHWNCVPYLEMQLQAADALAKAARHHVHSQAMSNPLCELCGLIAAYEKTRNGK